MHKSGFRKAWLNSFKFANHYDILFMLVSKVCLSREHNFLTVEIFLHVFRAGGIYQV